jgi:pimeloyl-ACP methyl ester carboxylesterase
LTRPTLPKCDSSGAKIFYEEFGSGSTLIIFVSGTGFHSGIWKPFQVPYFSKERKVIISDHRGTGRSDKPDESYSTRQFASDIVALMDNLGIEKAHVLGHSMGGRVSQWIALDHPERVKSMILASSGSGNFKKSPEYVRGIPLSTAFEIAKFGFSRYFSHHVRSDFFYTTKFLKANSPQLKKAVSAHIRNPPPAKMYLRHVLARQMHETSDLVSEIRAPALVTVGELDTAERGTASHYESSEWLAKAIPGAAFVPQKGLKHGTFWERPEEINRIVQDFIRRHD